MKLYHQIILRIITVLCAVGIYKFDRALGLDEGTSIVTVVVTFLWWTPNA